MAINTIQDVISKFTSIEQAMEYFEISYDQEFIEGFGSELAKRFRGNLILEKPEDWFDARRALKNAYCKIQRGRLSKETRSACRGCTTCQRR